MFDPHREAHRQHIHLSYIRGLPFRGLWMPDVHTIYLRHGMSWVEERCTLAHELGHAHYGHRDQSPKNERQADEWAAAQLLGHVDYYPADITVADFCHEHDVTPRILLAHLRTRKAS